MRQIDWSIKGNLKRFCPINKNLSALFRYTNLYGDFGERFGISELKDFQEETLNKILDSIYILYCSWLVADDNDLYDRSVIVFLHNTQLAIVADAVVKLILPLKAEEFRCYNDYFDWMILLNIIHENELL
jgi:hypothetical protein